MFLRIVVAATLAGLAAAVAATIPLTTYAAQAADKAVSQKLMPVSVGLDAAGHPAGGARKCQAAGHRTG